MRTVLIFLGTYAATSFTFCALLMLGAVSNYLRNTKEVTR